MSNYFVYVPFFFLLILIFANACQGENEIKKAQFFTNGKSLYTVNCENCHGVKGEGLGNLYPPLSDTASIQSNRTRLSCMIKYGIHEELIIDNRKFDTEMPANLSLTEQEIAYILTYVGNSFGNELGLVSTEEVSSTLKRCGQDQ